MANTSSAKKALKQNKKAHDANKSQRTKVRTYAKKVEAAIASQSSSREEAIVALKEYEKVGMKSVSKKIFHINTIARKISRLYASIVKRFDKKEIAS